LKDGLESPSSVAGAWSVLFSWSTGEPKAHGSLPLPSPLRKQGSSPRAARNTEGMRLPRNGEAVRFRSSARHMQSFGWAASAQRTRSVLHRAFPKPSGFLLAQE
ncbi:MAG: hypothetical protein R6V12_11760, partial [Candidatus Hydrogenedentota bacterium]